MGVKKRITNLGKKHILGKIFDQISVLGKQKVVFGNMFFGSLLTT